LGYVIRLLPREFQRKEKKDGPMVVDFVRGWKPTKGVG